MAKVGIAVFDWLDRSDGAGGLGEIQAVSDFLL